jgi:hypothetical protein
VTTLDDNAAHFDLDQAKLAIFVTEVGKGAASCAETATGDTSGATDLAACAAVTSLADATACDAIMKDLDSTAQACTYTRRAKGACREFATADAAACSGVTALDTALACENVLAEEGGKTRACMYTRLLTPAGGLAIPIGAGGTVSFGDVPVIFDSLPARTDRTVTITAMDAAANSANCDITLHVLASKGVPSDSTIEMAALTTSATQEYQLQIENVGDLVLKINTADVLIAGDLGEQWAAVKFQAGNQIVQVGQPGSHIVEVQPKAVTVVYVQFDGVKAPDAAFCCDGDGSGCRVTGWETTDTAKLECEASSIGAEYKPLGKGGTYSSTLRIPTNDPDPNTSTISIPLVFTTVDTALVIVGLPRSIDITMRPGSVQMKTVSVYNVWPDAITGLDFLHTGAEEPPSPRSKCTDAASICTPSDVMTTCSTAAAASCAETATGDATADATDLAACAAVTSLADATACDAIMKDLDSTAQACTYTMCTGCCKVPDPNNPDREGTCDRVAAHKMVPDSDVYTCTEAAVDPSVTEDATACLAVDSSGSQEAYMQRCNAVLTKASDDSDLQACTFAGTGVCCRQDVCLFETWGNTKTQCEDGIGSCTDPVDATTKSSCIAGTFTSTAEWKPTGIGSAGTSGLVTIESCTEHIDQGASITMPLHLHAPVTTGTCKFKLSTHRGLHATAVSRGLIICGGSQMRSPGICSHVDRVRSVNCSDVTHLIWRC